MQRSPDSSPQVCLCGSCANFVIICKTMCYKDINKLRAQIYPEIRTVVNAARLN